MLKQQGPAQRLKTSFKDQFGATFHQGFSLFGDPSFMFFKGIKCSPGDEHPVFDKVFEQQFHLPVLEQQRELTAKFNPVHPLPFWKPLVMVSKHFLEKVSDSLEMCSMEISFLRWIHAEDLLSTLKSLENFSRLASGESGKQTYFSFQDTSDRLKKNHFLDSSFLVIRCQAFQALGKFTFDPPGFSGCRVDDPSSSQGHQWGVTAKDETVSVTAADFLLKPKLGQGRGAAGKMIVFQQDHTAHHFLASKVKPNPAPLSYVCWSIFQQAKFHVEHEAVDQGIPTCQLFSTLDR